MKRASTGGRHRNRRAVSYASVLATLLTTVALICLPFSSVSLAARSAEPEHGPPASHPPHIDGKLDDWKGSSPMLGGEWVVSAGEFVYQDYLYDDLGAAVGDAAQRRNDGFARGGGSKDTGIGTYMYPKDFERYGSNAADINQIRARRHGNQVQFAVVFNTLLAPDTTVVGLALGDGGADRMAWPLAAGIETPGTKHVITAWGTGASFDDLPISAVGGSVAVDIEDNAFEISLPAKLVGKSFRAYAAAGLWDPANQHWMQVVDTRTATQAGGGDGVHPNIFNVAFRDDEDTTTGPKKEFTWTNWWWDRAQAAALAESNIDKYFVDIDLAAADTPTGIITGYHQRIYRSSVHIAPPYEGISEGGVIGWEANPAVVWRYNFLGPWQTYNVYVPEEFDRMTVLLHGSGLSTFGIWFPGVQHDLGDANGSILVDPLALGPSSGYADYAELAVLEAMDDARENYPVDPGRTVLGGVSMGGVGTYRMLALHPDEFGGGVDWSGCAGSPGYCTIVEMEPGDLFANYRNNELFIHHGALDWLLPVHMAVHNAGRMEALGYPYRLAIFTQTEHTGFYSFDSWKLESEFIRPLRIVENPVRVTYKTSEAWWRPEISPRLVYDHAYWVSGLHTRNTSLGDRSYGTVDATTLGLGHGEYSTRPIPPSISTGAELEPKNCQFTGPSARAFCMTHTFSGREKVEGEETPRQNFFSASLTNLRAAAFDMQRMGLTMDEPLVAEISTDGAADVTILGTGPVNVDGAEAVQEGDDVVVKLPASGTYTVTLTRA